MVLLTTRETQRINTETLNKECRDLNELKIEIDFLKKKLFKEDDLDNPAALVKNIVFYEKLADLQGKYYAKAGALIDMQYQFISDTQS